MKLECRKRDLVIRIADWSEDEHEPGYDVEVYLNGAYVRKHSKCCTVHQYQSIEVAKERAFGFAAEKIKELIS